MNFSLGERMHSVDAAKMVRDALHTANTSTTNREDAKNAVLKALNALGNKMKNKPLLFVGDTK